MKLIERCKQITLLEALLGILVFYLPIQCRYERVLKILAKRFCSLTIFVTPNFDQVLHFYITDLVMIALLITCLSQCWSALREHWSLALFIGISLLSGILSKNGSFAWLYMSWAQMALPILLCIVLSKKIGTKGGVRLFCWVFLGAALLESAISLGQYFLQGPIGLKHFGEQNIDSLHCASFCMANKSLWILDKLFDTQTASEVILRATGTFPHPNILGGFMGVALLITSWLFLEMPKRLLWKQIWLGAAIFFQIFILFITYSRAALFGWIGAFSIFLFLACRLYPIKSLAIVVIVGGLLSGLLLQEQLLNRGGVINYNQVAKMSDLQRLTYQEIALKIAKQHPWLGVGWNQFLLYAKAAAGKDVPQDFHFLIVHSIYFLLLAETGILGLSCFLFFAISLIWRAWRGGITRERVLLLPIWLFLLAVGFCDHYLLTGQHGRILLFVSAALLASQRAGKIQGDLVPPAGLRKAGADSPSC
jgi:O-Antigen ligase